MHKFLTLLEGGIIGASLLIIFDHVVGKLASRHTYYRPTYYGPYRPTYRSYSNFRDDEDEEEEENDR